MKTPKIDNSAQLRAEESARIARLESENLRKNMAQDLTTSNVATVVAGGEAQGTDDLLRKRKRTQPGLASQLGINV